jgi:hypothetical protein
MKNILLLLSLCSFLFLCGCGKKTPPKDPAFEKEQQTPVRCTKCRRENPLKNYVRVNQVLARCPACQKVIHIAEARFGKKNKRR